MARAPKWVFLNLPYDREFEPLYLAYVVGLVRLGFEPKLMLAIPNDIGRLDTIIHLIQSCENSIHDLSRVQPNAAGIPRFNMPLELGLALYRSRTTADQHRPGDDSCLPGGETASPANQGKSWNSLALCCSGLPGHRPRREYPEKEKDGEG
jgi:hypothetical protein